MKGKKTALTFLSILALSSTSSTTFACTGFIIGKNLTTDGTAYYGRTEDLEPHHNKTFIVHDAKKNKAGAKTKLVLMNSVYPCLPLSLPQLIIKS